MRSFFLVIGLFFFGFTICAQDSDFSPIEELGWQIMEFSEPPDLRDSDIGEVNYLLTLDANGKVTRIKVLSSSFEKKTEKRWRRQILKSKFTRLKNNKPAASQYRGTLLITREMCSKDSEDL